MRAHPLSPLETAVGSSCLAYSRARDRARETPRTSPTYASALAAATLAERSAVAALRDLPGGERGDTVPFKAGESVYWLDVADRLYVRPFAGPVYLAGGPASPRALQRRAQRARVKREAKAGGPRS